MRLQAILLLLCSLFLSQAGAAPLAYITNERGGVSVLNLDDLSFGRSLDVGGEGPRGLGVTSDGRFLVTANKGTSDISVLDTGSGAVVRRIPVGKNVEFVRVYGDLAYVTYEPGGSGAPDAAGKGGKDSKPEKGGKGEDDDDDKVPAQIAVVDL